MLKTVVVSKVNVEEARGTIGVDTYCDDPKEEQDEGTDVVDVEELVNNDDAVA